MEKIAKTQLVDKVASKTGLSKKQAGAAIDAFVTVVVTSIREGKTVGLPGVGTFRVVDTKERMGVYPFTTNPLFIPAKKKVSFKVASTLKNQL